MARFVYIRSVLRDEFDAMVAIQHNPGRCCEVLRGHEHHGVLDFDGVYDNVYTADIPG